MAQQHVHVGERAAHHDGVAGCAAVPKGDLHRRFGGAVHVDEAHRRRQTLQRQPSHRERQRLATAEHIAQLALQRRQQDRQGRRRLKELPKDRRHKLRRGHALAHQRVREQRRRQHDVVGGHHHGGATGPRPEELECGHIKEQPRAPQHAVGRRERKLDARLVNVVGVAAAIALAACAGVRSCVEPAIAGVLPVGSVASCAALGIVAQPVAQKSNSVTVVRNMVGMGALVRVAQSTR